GEMDSGGGERTRRKPGAMDPGRSTRRGRADGPARFAPHHPPPARASSDACRRTPFARLLSLERSQALARLTREWRARVLVAELAVALARLRGLFQRLEHAAGAVERLRHRFLVRVEQRDLEVLAQRVVVLALGLEQSPDPEARSGGELALVEAQR